MRHLIFISLCSLLWTACGNTDNDFDASGTFEATEILVSSEANGKIMELNIEEGDRLDAGAIVGYVDSTQLFLRKMQLSASLRSVDIRKPDIRKQIAVLEQQISPETTGCPILLFKQDDGRCRRRGGGPAISDHAIG